MDVEPLCRFLALGSSQGQDVELALGHYQSMMVSPAVGTTHDLCHSHVLYVPLSGDDRVDQVPMLGPWMHPRSLVAGRGTEQCVGEDKVTGGTQL